MFSSWPSSADSTFHTFKVKINTASATPKAIPTTTAASEAFHVVHLLRMAISALTNRGASTALPVIHQSLRPAYKGQGAKDLRLYLNGYIEVLQRISTSV